MQPTLASYPIIAFVATTQPDRARDFYTNTLGLKLLSEDGFALAFDANGIMLRVQIVERHVPPGYTALGWMVPDIAAAALDLAARGVTFSRYEWMDQDAQGIWTSPSGARVAWFQDPDGNTLSLTQFH